MGIVACFVQSDERPFGYTGEIRPLRNWGHLSCADAVSGYWRRPADIGYQVEWPQN